MFSLVLFLCSISIGITERSFYVDWENDRFVKDGETFQYASAGTHYFRVPHEYWAQRISAAKSAGLNAVQTYVAWNSHEPKKGVYNFEGENNLIGFIKEVQSQDMVLILRVGPYICAEWNFGGLPPWLLGFPDMQVRTRNKDYLNAVDSWLKVLLPMIAPYLYANGGPIIMIQLENEYGGFGCDHEYKDITYNMFHDQLGDSTVYFTTDGPNNVACGSYPNRTVLTTIDCGQQYCSNPTEIFAKLRKYQPQGPLVNSEYYTGWLDHWGHPHSTTDAQKVGVAIGEFLQLGASMNLYMWTGGSNFGTNSGTGPNPTQPNPTGYDYDAPQSECGDIKLDKYWAIRNATAARFQGNTMPVPTDPPKFGGVALKPVFVALMTDLVGKETFIARSAFPQTGEQLGVFEGFVIYQHEVDKPMLNVFISVLGVRDRAYILVDGVFLQVIKRADDSMRVSANVQKSVTIITENMGYVNVGGAILDPEQLYKGMTNATMNSAVCTGWNHYHVSAEMFPETLVRNTRSNTHKVKVSSDMRNSVGGGEVRGGKGLLPHGPTYYHAQVSLYKPQLLDTFLNITESWSKGYLYVNYKLVGRFWPDAGPQFTLYVPGVWLRPGLNDIYLLELQSFTGAPDSVYFTDKAYIDGPVDPNA